MQYSKEIALLNLHYDNNYGGNLQRYALVTILQRMGYNVTYLYMRFNWSNKGRSFWIRNTIKNAIKHYIFSSKNEPVFAWKSEDSRHKEMYSITEPFLEQYIPHSPIIWGRRWLEQYVKHHHFDAYIVGSDQVWRKSYTMRYGIGMWFFDFLPNNYTGKRIAYGASFGVEDTEYTKDEQDIIRPLFQKFNAVSVREESGLNILKKNGWTSPKATCVLDPTILLTAEDYEGLINAAKTEPLTDKLWCYVLDMNKEKEQLISQKSMELSLNPTIQSISANNRVTVEQWLRNFRDAEYVITDSYHGLIFALLFHKPFSLIINHGRGAARFDSLKHMLAIDFDKPLDWNMYEHNLNIARRQSFDFLSSALTSCMQ